MKEIIGVVTIGNEASVHVLEKQDFKLRSTAFIDNLKIAYYYFSK